MFALATGGVLPAKGTVTQLFGASGAGKTALGLFLSEESCRRFSLPRRSQAYLGTQLNFDGPLPYVVYLDGSSVRCPVYELLRLQISQLFRARGRALCPHCGVAEVSQVVWSDLFAGRSAEFAFVTAHLSVPPPESLFEFAALVRALQVRRYLVEDALERIPEGDAEFLHQIAQLESIELVFAAIKVDDPDFEERLELAIVSARALAKPVKVFLAEIKRGESSVVKRSCSFSGNSELKCTSCLAEFEELPEVTLGGLIKREFCKLTFKEAATFFPWLGELRYLSTLQLDTPTTELSAVAIRDLFLLRLDQEKLSDSLVYCDGAVSCPEIVARLAERGNAVVLTYPYAEAPRVFCEGRLSALSRYKEKQRMVFQFIELPLAGLLAGLPEARRAGLTERDFRSPLCVRCKGLGFIKTEEELLGVELEVCPECLGQKVRRELQGVEYREKSFPEILGLTIIEARRLFASRPELSEPLHRFSVDILFDVCLGEMISQLPGQKYLALEIIRDGTKAIDLDSSEISKELARILHESPLGGRRF